MELPLFLGNLKPSTPINYEVDYRVRKLQFTGAFWTIVAGSTIEDLEPYPSFHFAEAGTTAYPLTIALTPSSYIFASPADATFSNGPWYDYKIVKAGQHLDVFVNSILQYSADGLPFDGGFLKVAAVQAGATVEMDDVRVYNTAPEPGSCVLFGVGLTMLLSQRRKRRV